ncbi:hypothetical protein HYT45_02230 [Candidatus Uhrbacteria bacterium]|nr:hypothetical protein [Candidatus Uhrbacteria bacterium]
MAACEHGLEIGQRIFTADRCSKCGGEKNLNGWCANFCRERAVSCRLCNDKGYIICPDCAGNGVFSTNSGASDDLCFHCDGDGVVHCCHCDEK